MTLNKEAILAGEVDIDIVKLKDIREFAKEAGLDMKFPNGMDIKAALNNVCDALDGAEPEPEDPAEEQKQAEEPATEKAEGPESPKSKEPAYLARRRSKIEAEQKRTAASEGGGGIDPAAYEGQKIPAFLKRRMKKGGE